jgi:hypothetical protein
MEHATDPANGDLRITAYNENLGFVTERRRLPLEKGLSRVELTDIPALIDPTSVHFTPGKGDVRVVEQNFQFDLANADRILQRYLTHPIEIVLKEGDLKRGDLVSYDERSLVLRSEQGEIGLVLRSEVVDVRLPSLPEGLRATPTLSWLIESAAASDESHEFSYLTGGISWHAEYVATTGEADSEVELAAWVSLDNRSGKAFTDAGLQLMAGRVHQVHSFRAPGLEQEGFAMVLKRRASSPVQEESLFEYHLYSLDRVITIADRESKQIALFPSRRCPVTKSYRYEGGRHSRNVEVLMEIENREDRGLGIALPAGTLRIYKRDSSGRLHFIGEDVVEHTPRGEKINLAIGTAFDLVGERTVRSRERVSKETAAEDVEVVIRNRKREPVEVIVRETLWSHWRIMKSSHEYAPRTANSIDFKLTVPADAEEALSFAYRHDA